MLFRVRLGLEIDKSFQHFLERAGILLVARMIAG
jgi:hypothetical protein